MFPGYLHDEERYRKCFADGWYFSGDLAKRDADGYFWFVGRADDIIKTAGHMVGPFEVERALMEHPAVSEAGVIGKPDPMIGELVKAFVALKIGHEPTDALRVELLGFARKKLGSAVAPKEIEFQNSLPKTRSGKIMRRLLKARGMDVLAVESAARKAAEYVRNECRPYFLEARTCRFCAHSMFDPGPYRPKAEVEEWKQHGPIVALTSRLKTEGIITEDDFQKLEQEVAAEVADSVAFAEAGTWEPVEDLLRFVHSERSPA